MKQTQNIILERFIVGMLQTNCYLLGDSQSGESVVIDPGGNSDRIAAKVAQLKLRLSAILNTHAHFDHIMEAWTLKKITGAEIYLHPRDRVLLQDRTVGLAAVLGSQAAAEGSIDYWLKAGELLKFGSIKLEVIETPGHTPGHVSFYFPQGQMIFVGDTLFAGSIGRTDFPGGSYDQLIRSVRERIFPLPGETIVYSGHGPETTIERESRTNPFFA
jgi:hydroxyacylglutathione hydrolase